MFGMAMRDAQGEAKRLVFYNNMDAAYAPAGTTAVQGGVYPPYTPPRAGNVQPIVNIACLYI